MQPDVIGHRYRVVRTIGHGGMGEVWLCEDEVLHRKVAVKQVGLLPGETATDSARAFREARSGAALSHRNVVTVFDVIEEDGRIWLVMEYVAGQSLSRMIQEKGALDPALVADVGAQVASGLAAAHRAGTTHRDVKPGNVLVGEDGVAKISDFGIARTSGDPTLTGSGMLTGTPSYFSPELARGGRPGVADDVWALGATLHAAVQGRPPFRPTPNPVGVLHEIATTPPPPAVRAKFLAPALERMMDPDPASRWSMEDAEHVLHRLADEHRPEKTLQSTRASKGTLPTTAAPAPRPSPSAQRADPQVPEPQAPEPRVPGPRSPSRTRRRRSRALPVVVGCLAVLVALAAALLLRQAASHQQGGPSASTGSAQDGTKQHHHIDSSTSPDSSGTGVSSEARDKEQFVRDYYAAAPGGSDAAWAMLGPGEKQQGRDRYDAFWRTIDSVDVRSVHATSGSDSVDATLIYHESNGRTSTEHKVEGLIDQGHGSYLIDTDRPAG